MQQKNKGKVSGYPVKAVDTTGAGDSFVGSLLTSIAKDSSIFEVCSCVVFSYIFVLFL